MKTKTCKIYKREYGMNKMNEYVKDEWGKIQFPKIKRVDANTMISSILTIDKMHKNIMERDNNEIDEYEEWDDEYEE